MGSDRFWVVRVPQDEEAIDKVRNVGVVAIGFYVSHSLGGADSLEDLKRALREAAPEITERKVSYSAGQLNRIVNEFQPGHWILTPLRDTRKVLFGQITGEYLYIPEVIAPGYAHARKVKWLGEFRRDDMSAGLRNSMGSHATIVDITRHAAELLGLMGQTPAPETTSNGAVDPVPPSLFEETRAKADEIIGDLVAQIDPYDFQQLVAGLLQAMGYRTRVSERGPDQGVDVVAHPDALGFESPKIKVQVKHRQSAAGGPDVRNLKGTLGEGEKGLFISTGGFTSEAINEARRSPHLTLINGQEFVDLLIEHYEHLDSDFKALVPLRRVWIPVSS